VLRRFAHSTHGAFAARAGDRHSEVEKRLANPCIVAEEAAQLERRISGPPGAPGVSEIEQLDSKLRGRCCWMRVGPLPRGDLHIAIGTASGRRWAHCESIGRSVSSVDADESVFSRLEPARTPEAT